MSLQAISIIECDLNVDFATPIGYEPPTKQSAPVEEEEPAPIIVDSAFTPFAGKYCFYFLTVHIPSQS